MDANGGAAVILAGALAAGVVAQMVARHLRLPGIIVLLPLGVALGPDGTGWIQPSVLGSMQQALIGMALSVILFEGGLQLDIRHLRREALVIRRLITAGVMITASLASLAAFYFMHWPWQTSMLFGTLVIVTGPTVVGPLLRRFSINRNLHTILEAEGILIDPVGAFIASLGMQLAVSFSANTLAIGITTVAMKLCVGIGIGLVGGFVLGGLLCLEPSAKRIPEWGVQRL